MNGNPNQPNLSFTCKQLRYTSEVFTSAHFSDKAAFTKGCELAKSKGFAVEIKEYPLTETICVTIPKLKSDKANAYAMAMLKRGLEQEGFRFPFSVSWH